MIRLGLTQGPRKIKLRVGVTLTIAPIDGITWDVQQQAAAREARDLIAAHLESKEAGGPGTLPGAVISEDFLTSVSHYCFALALAKSLIKEWDAGDQDGNPAPVTPQWIEALFKHPGVSDDFLSKVEIQIAPLREEGNGSGALADGGQAGAPNTAGGAEN